jgi:hypothetical protein
MCRAFISVAEIPSNFCRTVEEVNEIHRKQGTIYIIDKISEPIDGNEYTTIFFINIINQEEKNTINFRRRFPNVEEYNNLLHSANGYSQILVKYCL